MRKTRKRLKKKLFRKTRRGGAFWSLSSIKEYLSKLKKERSEDVDKCIKKENDYYKSFINKGPLLEGHDFNEKDAELLSKVKCCPSKFTRWFRKSSEKCNKIGTPKDIENAEDRLLYTDKEKEKRIKAATNYLINHRLSHLINDKDLLKEYYRKKNCGQRSKYNPLYQECKWLASILIDKYKQEETVLNKDNTGEGVGQRDSNTSSYRSTVDLVDEDNKNGSLETADLHSTDEESDDEELLYRDAKESFSSIPFQQGESFVRRQSTRPSETRKSALPTPSFFSSIGGRKTRRRKRRN